MKPSHLNVLNTYIKTMMSLYGFVESVLKKVVYSTIFIKMIPILFMWFIVAVITVIGLFFDAISFLFVGPDNYIFVNKPELFPEIYIRAGGDTMSGIEKIWNLITSNFSLLIGLLLIAQALRIGLYKVSAALEKHMNTNSFSPLSMTYFKTAELKHDADGNPYMTVGILTETIKGNSFYVAFYTDIDEPVFVHVNDEKPYKLSALNYLPADVLKQIESFSQNVSKLKEEAQEALNTYPVS